MVHSGQLECPSDRPSLKPSPGPPVFGLSVGAGVTVGVTVSVGVTQTFLTLTWVYSISSSPGGLNPTKSVL
ncbi:hypothetical protein HZA75_02835 [Candidatus Roizmanbacteria bacterium]|nr:hypothetical protein [Candidatus Roizmanbacteria bacterium]